MEPNNANDVRIAVMGLTGSGKSSFINLASQSATQLEVSDSLRSCTDTVLRAEPFMLDGRRVVLFDTPGFDDTSKSESEILQIIATEFENQYRQGQTLHGVIYMHRISDIRITSLAKAKFQLFRKICGDKNLANVVILTSMWNKVCDEEGGCKAWELATMDDFFLPAVEKGAVMLHHKQDTVASAHEIIRPFLTRTPAALALQEEIVDQHLSIAETGAGRVVAQLMLENSEERDEEAQRLRKVLERLENEKGNLVRQYQDLQTRLSVSEEQHRKDMLDTEARSCRASEAEEERRLTLQIILERTEQQKRDLDRQYREIQEQRKHDIQEAEKRGRREFELQDSTEECRAHLEALEVLEAKKRDQDRQIRELQQQLDAAEDQLRRDLQDAEERSRRDAEVRESRLQKEALEAEQRRINLEHLDSLETRKRNQDRQIRELQEQLDAAEGQLRRDLREAEERSRRDAEAMELGLRREAREAEERRVHQERLERTEEERRILARQYQQLQEQRQQDVRDAEERGRLEAAAGDATEERQAHLETLERLEAKRRNQDRLIQELQEQLSTAETQLRQDLQDAEERSRRDAEARESRLKKEAREAEECREHQQRLERTEEEKRVLAQQYQQLQEQRRQDTLDAEERRRRDAEARESEMHDQARRYRELQDQLSAAELQRRKDVQAAEERGRREVEARDSTEERRAHLETLERFEVKKRDQDRQIQELQGQLDEAEEQLRRDLQDAEVRSRRDAEAKESRLKKEAREEEERRASLQILERTEKERRDLARQYQELQQQLFTTAEQHRRDIQDAEDRGRKAGELTCVKGEERRVSVEIFERVEQEKLELTLQYRQLQERFSLAQEQRRQDVAAKELEVAELRVNFVVLEKMEIEKRDQARQYRELQEQLSAAEEQRRKDIRNAEERTRREAEAREKEKHDFTLQYRELQARLYAAEQQHLKDIRDAEERGRQVAEGTGERRVDFEILERMEREKGVLVQQYQEIQDLRRRDIRDAEERRRREAEARESEKLDQARRYRELQDQLSAAEAQRRKDIQDAEERGRRDAEARNSTEERRVHLEVLERVDREKQDLAQQYLELQQQLSAAEERHRKLIRDVEERSRRDIEARELMWKAEARKVEKPRVKLQILERVGKEVQYRELLSPAEERRRRDIQELEESVLRDTAEVREEMRTPDAEAREAERRRVRQRVVEYEARMRYITTSQCSRTKVVIR